MADTKISALTAATTLGDTDEMVLASSGASKKITGANLKASIPGALTLLSTTTLSSPGTFDVSSISGAYNDLILVLIARSAFSGITDDPLIRLNNDTAANYLHVRVTAAGGGAIAAAYSGATTFSYCGYLPGATASASLFGVCEIVLHGYASTTWKKNYQWVGTTNGDPSSGTASYSRTGGGLWNSTAAITRVGIVTANTANMATGSQLRIYGRL